MRAVVLGADGQIGRVVAAALSARGSFEQLILADRNAPPTPPEGRTETRTVDATDPAALHALLADADIVVNCTTYHLGLRILDAAISSGVHYVDLGGLYNTPRQLEMHDRATAARVTAVLGCGATPGLSNLMALACARRLERAEEVHISFASHRDLAPSPGLLDTILDEFRPGVERYYRDGDQLVPVGAFDGERRVRFPAPVGNQDVYFVPHSELHTLHRNIPGLKRVAVRGTWRPDDMARLRALAELGLTTDTAVQVDGMPVTPLSVVRSTLLANPPKGDGLCAFFLHVEVSGRGMSAAAVASHPADWGDDATARMTGLPTVVAAELVSSGPGKPGVLAPEAAFEPDAFFAAVRALEIQVKVRRPQPVVSRETAQVKSR